MYRRLGCQSLRCNGAQQQMPQMPPRAYLLALRGSHDMQQLQGRLLLALQLRDGGLCCCATGPIARQAGCQSGFEVHPCAQRGLSRLSEQHHSLSWLPLLLRVRPLPPVGQAGTVARLSALHTPDPLASSWPTKGPGYGIWSWPTEYLLLAPCTLSAAVLPSAADAVHAADAALSLEVAALACCCTAGCPPWSSTSAGMPNVRPLPHYFM